MPPGVNRTPWAPSHSTAALRSSTQRPTWLSAGSCTAGPLRGIDRLHQIHLDAGSALADDRDVLVDVLALAPVRAGHRQPEKVDPELAQARLVGAADGDLLQPEDTKRPVHLIFPSFSRFHGLARIAAPHGRAVSRAGPSPGSFPAGADAAAAPGRARAPPATADVAARRPAARRRHRRRSGGRGCASSRRGGLPPAPVLAHPRPATRRRRRRRTADPACDSRPSRCPRRASLAVDAGLASSSRLASFGASRVACGPAAP